MRRLNFGTVGIVGLGVIGCSIGARLRQVGVAKAVLGFDHDDAALKKAIARGAVDTTYDTLNHLGDADLLVLAVPSISVLPCLIEADIFCKLNCVVTDTSSVKGQVVNWTQKYPLRFGPRFVGGHPMVDKPQRPNAELFEGKPWVITPSDSTDQTAVQNVSALITALGARPMVLSPEEHDRHAAILSHLPTALAGALAQLGNNLVYPEMADPAWRTLTRAAHAEPALWASLLRNNREEVVSALEDLEFTLRQLRRAIEADQHEDLMEFLETSRRARSAWGA
jgi:prephenate dehydrogenase